MKKILINMFVFLTANICFAADLNNQQTNFSKETPYVKLMTVTNTFIQMFDGTNTYTMSIEDFISFSTNKKENENGIRKWNPEDFIWEPDEKLKRLWGDYYDSINNTDDSSEETFNGIPIVKGGPAKETILECVIEENPTNSFEGKVLLPGVYIGTNYCDWNGDESKKHFEELNEKRKEFTEKMPFMDENGKCYDSSYEYFQNIVTNILINYYDGTRAISSPSILDDITWVYENFDGYINVLFEVVGYGFSNASKQELEKEIREAIQKIIDLHFPKEKD